MVLLACLAGIAMLPTGLCFNKDFFLARRASRCRKAYILLLWFFLPFFSMPNLWGHWTDLKQTWTHIPLWLLFQKFGPNSPKHLPHGLGGRKNRFLGLTLNFDQTYLCNGTWYPQSEKKLVKLWSRNGWEWSVSLCPPPYILHWEHCQPYRMDVI